MPPLPKLRTSKFPFPIKNQTFKIKNSNPQSLITNHTGGVCRLAVFRVCVPRPREKIQNQKSSRVLPRPLRFLFSHPPNQNADDEEDNTDNNHISVPHPLLRLGGRLWRLGKPAPRFGAEPNPQRGVNQGPQRIQPEKLSQWHPVPPGKEKYPKPDRWNKPPQKNRFHPMPVVEPLDPLLPSRGEYKSTQPRLQKPLPSMPSHEIHPKIACEDA